MNVARISSLILTQIDDDPTTPSSATAAEVLAAINEGQELAALLTLCFEATADFALAPAACFHQPRTILTDFLAPLRLTLNGARIRPATLAEMEAENTAWQATAGTPKRYACLGCNLLMVTPQPAAPATARMTYARTPTALVQPTDTPELDEAYHQNLVDYGVYRVRLKEGAQGLERGLKRLNAFLDDMARLESHVRARSAAAHYDIQPFEMAGFDRSRLIDEVLKWQARSKPQA